MESDYEVYSELDFKPSDYEAYSDLDCKPSIILEAAEESNLDILPAKSKERYEFAYSQYMNWCQEKEVESQFSENSFLEYFEELSAKSAPSTLWPQYSMLRSTLSIHQNVDIAKYVKLKAFLKRKTDGYKPKKSKILTSDEINRFLNEAPDDKHLLQKVVLIVGISGGCRREELVQLKVDDIEDLGSAVLMKIPDTKTKQKRSFIITGEFYKFYKKYAALRPSDTYERRFFLNYQNQKCTKQPVGKNKIASTPKQIATYLCLQEPESYTGHCFRRSSTFISTSGRGWW